MMYCHFYTGLWTIWVYAGTRSRVPAVSLTCVWLPTT